MKSETKTWPAHMEQAMNFQREKLITSAQKTIESSWSPFGPGVRLNLSGLDLKITFKEAAQILESRLVQEQEQYLSICKKYNELGLSREAIVKTKIFNSIIRKIDLQKDLFTFSTFDEDGRVRGNIKNLNNSKEFFRLLGKLELYVHHLLSAKDFSEKTARNFLSLAVNQMKDDLWPKRSDAEKSTCMRRVPVSLPDAPINTKQRIVEWYKKGFFPYVIVHRDAVMPSIPMVHLDKIRTLLSFKKLRFEDGGQEVQSIEDFRDYLDEVGYGEISRQDPIFCIEDGEWTIIIDQYADFPKEKEIVDVIKSHYMLLKNKYGILDQKN